MENIRVSREDIKTYSLMDGLSLQNLFYLNNETYPSCYMFSGGYDRASINVDKIIKSVKKKYTTDQYEMCVYTTYNISSNYEKKGLFLYLKSLNIFTRIEDNLSDSYILYGNDNEKGLNIAKKLILNHYSKPKEEKSNFYLISNGSNGFKLNKYKINKPAEFEIADNYNDDFIEADEEINNFINDNRSGLVILHGIKGSGKTSYIRKLINENDKYRFIFVPTNLIGLLGDPSFNDFLFTLKDSIIILEDCENALKARSGASNAGAVSLLLNMCDGLLSDAFNIKFICTFNENISKIDDALLRKGRLACKYEFKELNLEKTKALIKREYGIDYTDNKPLTLADIFNFKAKSYENSKHKSIGIGK